MRNSCRLVCTAVNLTMDEWREQAFDPCGASKRGATEQDNPRILVPNWYPISKPGYS